MPGFLSDEEATALFDALMAEVTWEQKHMTFYGKQVALPRLVAWYGDPGADYFYSGIQNTAQPWTPALAALKPRLDALLPERMTFNGVLLNYYRDGNDKIGFHADNEKELGERPFIASLSVGARRRFLLRPKGKNGRGKATKEHEVEIPLDNGTLVLMHGVCQKEWLHSVPPELKPTGPRINLTLRQVL
jgi:alkylated DNA repair dioxygenase AlkB